VDAVSGASLALKGVTKRYGSHAAVDGVSLDVRAGEFLTLLGPSGSGKTTTLNMIAGLTEVTVGEILLDGAPIDELPPHQRNIGVVFQHYALFPHMSVAENVAFPLRRRGVQKEERSRRITDALGMVHLTDFADRYPRELSGGQQQRVALARALIFNPRVVLMDEPLGSLDKKLRDWLQLEIKRIHRELGITFIYVTHDQDEAIVLSDRIALFRDGQIEQIGAVDQLYERPETVFVAEFIGDSNMFSGRLVEQRNGLRLRSADYELYVPAAAGLPNGTSCAVMVRPERIHLTGHGKAPADDDNVLRAQVRQVVYLGSSRKLELDLPGNHRVVVREQGGSVDSRPQVSEGDTVEIFWSPRESVLLTEAHRQHRVDWDDVAAGEGV
jgi:putative spermidine/putrescine transport system ATP-binding protein